MDPNFIGRNSSTVGPGFWGAVGLSKSLDIKQELEKMNELENIMKNGLNKDSAA